MGDHRHRTTQIDISTTRSDGAAAIGAPSRQRCLEEIHSCSALRQTLLAAPPTSPRRLCSMMCGHDDLRWSTSHGVKPALPHACGGYVESLTQPARRQVICHMSGSAFRRARRSVHEESRRTLVRVKVKYESLKVKRSKGIRVQNIVTNTGHSLAYNCRRPNLQLHLTTTRAARCTRHTARATCKTVRPPAPPTPGRASATGATWRGGPAPWARRRRWRARR